MPGSLLLRLVNVMRGMPPALCRLFSRGRTRKGDEVFRLVAQGASDGLVLMEADSRIVWANAAYCRIMGYELHEMVGRYPLTFVLPPEECLSLKDARAFRFDPAEERFGKLTRVRNMRKDGTLFMHEFSHAVIPTPDGNRFLLIGRDITDSVEREEALIAAREHVDLKARTDALTGLSNRLEMRRALDDLLAAPSPFAVMQLDMNKFKQINDTYGHNAGDALLCHFAQILKRQCSPDWVVARTGGDEFVILAPNLTTLAEAVAHAAILVDAARTPMAWNAGTLVGQTAVGVAVRETGTDPSADELLNASDIALYAAKGRSEMKVAGYDAKLHNTFVQQQRLQKYVSEAISARRITFHFQPIVDMAARRVIKFEMLARCELPHKGVLPPNVFLPAAQKLGLIQELDFMVIDTATEALKRLHTAGFGDVGVSINISDEGLMDKVPDHIIWQADSNALDPDRISIEVLETTAISLSEDDAAFQKLRALSDAGFKIFLDDFGMGYAGLAHLVGLDVDGIKIDRGLISVIDTNQTSHSIVSALINLCRELDLEVVAEGAETTEHIDIVNAIGPTLFQGYALSKPMPFDVALEWARGFETAPMSNLG